MSDSDPIDRLRQRLRAVEGETSELDDRLAAERAARQLLQRDVRWILRVSMGAAAVVATLISIAGQLLITYL